MFEVLLNRNFLILWIGQLLSQLADRMLVAILLLNVHYLTNNNLAMSLPMISFGLSALIFGAIAGVYVDRWHKKKILIYSNIFRAILILSFTFFPIARNSLLLIFTISFAIFTIAQYFIPAESSSIPLIVKKDQLLAANSLFMGTWMIATVVAFGLISLLSSIGINIKIIYAIAAGLYVLAALDLSSLKLEEKPHSKKHNLRSIIRDYMQGLSYVYKNNKAPIKYHLLQIFIASSIIAILSELTISFVQNTLNQGQESFGYFVAFAGIGMGVSILTLPKLANKISKRNLITSGFLISSLMLIGISTTSNIYLVLIYIFFLGFGNGYITIPIQTILQETTPSKIRGRIFGIQNVFISAAFTLPVVIAGYLADIYSVRSIFQATGIILLISTILIQIRISLKNNYK